jgi:hypothetical protein
VNNIVEHFASASSDQQLVVLGEETVSNKAITRLVRKELCTSSSINVARFVRALCAACVVCAVSVCAVVMTVASRIHVSTLPATVLAQIFDVGFKAWKFFGSYHLWDYFEAYGQLNGNRHRTAASLRLASNSHPTLRTDSRFGAGARCAGSP